MSNDSENTVSQASVKLPRNSYRLRCVSCEVGKSKKGDFQLIQTYEIFGAAPLQVDGVMVDINGIQMKNWQTLTQNSVDFFNLNRNSLGLPPVKFSDKGSINAADYKGLEGAAICESESQEVKNEVTGEPILNPHTGQPVIQWNKRINQWLPR
jgi:hypothetical protein